MNVQRVADLDDPRIADYDNVTDPELLRTRGLFVAEGRLVVRTLMTLSPFRARSVLVTDAAWHSLQRVFDALENPPPIYLASQAHVNGIVGFNIHRGCLALGERPREKPIREIVRPGSDPQIVVAIERIGNADNMGGIFRNALAFGAHAVLLSPGCCDPLYRKAIRTSIGASLRVPFTSVAAWPAGLEALRQRGFTLAALTPHRSAMPLGEFVGSPVPERLTVVVGAEGEGLSDAVLAGVNVRIRIPIARDVDSLNVATAAGIALQRIREACERGR